MVLILTTFTRHTRIEWSQPNVFGISLSALVIVAFFVKLPETYPSCCRDRTQASATRWQLLRTNSNHGSVFHVHAFDDLTQRWKTSFTWQIDLLLAHLFLGSFRVEPQKGSIV